MPPHKRSRLPRILLSVLFLAVAGFAIFKQQDILDWWTLRDYQAPASVSALAADTTMSAYSRKLFYINKPQLQGKAAFYKSCEEGETTVVLGCYKPKQGIYILDVEDQRLQGIEQVTAAHEMLHAAYERLSANEKKDIGAELKSYYATVTDESIKSKIDVYQKSGADITNELHSILGTEVISLPPNLETYYSQYFTNRSVVAGYAQKYQSVFTDRKNKLTELDAKLAELEAEVKANNSDLDTQQAIINAEAKRLDALLKQNQIEEYNAGVVEYNKMIIPFKSLIATTKQLIAEYKTILEERNQVAVEAQELNKALDSRIESSTTNTKL